MIHQAKRFEKMLEDARLVTADLCQKVYRSSINEMLKRKGYDRSLTEAEIDALPRVSTPFSIESFDLCRIHLHGLDGWEFPSIETDGVKILMTEWVHNDSMTIGRHLLVHGQIRDLTIEVPQDVSTPPVLHGCLDYPTFTDLQIKEIDHAAFVNFYIQAAGLNWLSRYYLPLVRQRPVEPKKPKMWDAVKGSLPRWIN